MTDIWPNHIKHFRKLKKLSLEKLGEALSEPTSKGMISQYERGERTPSLGRIYQIAEALGCKPGEILDGPSSSAETEASGGPPQPNETSSDLVRMALEAALHAVPQARVRADDLPVLAHAVCAVLRIVGSQQASPADPGFRDLVARTVAYAIEHYTPPPERAA